MRAKPNPALKKAAKKEEKKEVVKTSPKYNVVYKEEVKADDFLITADEEKSVLDLLTEE